MSIKAVESGVLHHLSASQIKTYRRCPRKWALEKVFGFRPPQTRAQTEGENGHAWFQAYYETGTLPPAPGDKADTLHSSIAGLIADPDMPKYGSSTLLVEYPRDYEMGLKLADIPIRGRIDLLDISDPGTARIIDLKTTKSLDYALSPGELQTDTQMILYAIWIYTKNPLCKLTTVTHAYAAKSAIRHKILNVEVTREQAAEVQADLEQVAADMALTAQATKWQDVPVCSGFGSRSSACNDYGGCPFRFRCGVAGDDDELPELPKLEATMALQQILDTRPGARGINPPDAALPEPSITRPPAAGETSVSAPGIVVDTGGLVIFVDCFPVKGPAATVNLDDEIHKRSQAICERAGVKYIREIKYGEGVTNLVASFETHPLTGVVLARSEGLAASVLDVLIPRATLVVRGI